MSTINDALDLNKIDESNMADLKIIKDVMT
jgi:hypothetical protein